MSGLDLQLPLTGPGELYQLVHLGKISRQSDGSNNINITAYFQKKHQKDGFTHLCDGPVERRVDLGYVSELQVGSLYSMEGRKVLDSIKVVTSTIDVTLGAKVQTTLMLKEILSGFSSINNFISEQLWHSIEETRYLIIDVDDIRVALPCVEFVRYFFYKGPGIVDFLYSYNTINDSCELFQLPAESNGFTAMLIVHDNRFTKGRGLVKDQVKAIAELSVNQTYRRSIYSSHTKLICHWNSLYNKPALEPRAYIINDGLIGKDVKLKLNGVIVDCHFQNAGKPVFLVSSIVSCQTNFLSYRHLLFHLPTRKAISFFQSILSGEGWNSPKPRRYNYRNT